MAQPLPATDPTGKLIAGCLYRPACHQTTHLLQHASLASQASASLLFSAVCSPWGYGIRACIGSQFALWEAKLFLAVILRCFRLVGSNTPCLGPREGGGLCCLGAAVSRECGGGWGGGGKGCAVSGQLSVKSMASFQGASTCPEGYTRLARAVSNTAHM
jgi:hypothetical protein